MAHASCGVSAGSRIVTCGPRRVVDVRRGVSADEDGRVTGAPDARPVCGTARWSGWVGPAVRMARDTRPSWPAPLRGGSPLFLCHLGLALAIALALDRDDLGVVGEAVDEGDRAGRVGEDRVPLLEA